MSISTHAGIAEREIVTTRIFDAPRDIVFAAWIDPQHIGQWWGPNGFTITTERMDVRPGGEWVFVMHGPDGTDYPNRIVYAVIERPGKLVYKHDSGDENEPRQFVTTVTFAEQSGKTVLTMRALFKTAAERDSVVREHNAIEGGNQTLGRLAAYLAASR
ncbi:MAG: SRPBCC family protein [Chloroflexi bacterium]|nr:SRPBCC family protein [Chloroflexota bacterium]